MTMKQKHTYKTIAFQGAPGAFSDMACRSVFPGVQTLPCDTFEEAFQAVADKKADLAMIPVDNTIAGRVADVHHLMPGGELFIIGEYFLPVRHALMGLKDAKKDDLKVVYSHIHAIPQCRKKLKSMGIEARVHADTAGAAREVAARGDKSVGAIASELAAETYGLQIFEKDMQDADHNTTRFVILSPEPMDEEPEDGVAYITSFIFRVRNLPAALYKAMGGFATNGVNMVKLESYVDARFQVAQFYADVVGHPEQKSLQLAMEELGFFASEVKFLGTYRAHPYRNL